MDDVMEFITARAAPLYSSKPSLLPQQSAGDLVVKCCEELCSALRHWISLR